MSFVNPLFFLGMLAAAVPILLHLIKRERAIRIEFPTLMFLRRISKKSIRYQKLRHLLLLLLRILALVLVALAFTRPFYELPAPTAAGGRVATAHIILLDNSLSMGYGDRWAKAKQAADDIVRGAESGDKVAILEFSDRTTAMTQTTSVLSEVQGRIEGGVDLSDRPTGYGQALKIAEKFALDAGTGKRIIHLISDFQKSGLGAEEQDFRLGPGIELKYVDLGSDDFSNIAFGDVQIIETDEGAAGGLKIKASVANFGNEDRNNLRVAMTADSRTVAEKRIESGKGTVQPVEFVLPGLTAGTHALVLEVEDPQLTSDNRFFMTVEARGKTPVTAVENSDSGKGRQAPSFFLGNALNVSTLSPYKLTSVLPQKFDSMGSVPGRLLIWNNAPGEGTAVQKKIQDFVKSGGGLVIVLADSSRAADFNRSFGSWLPVKIVDSATGRSNTRPRSAAEDFVLMTDIRMDHPIFHPFSEPHSGTFSSARFFEHARLTVDSGGDIPARFDNGDPALVSVAVDKGRVLIFPSSADDSTNDLPLKAVYAPFWQQMLRYLENTQDTRRWLQVGDTIPLRKLLVEEALKQGKGNVDLDQAIVVLDPDKQRLAIASGSDSAPADKKGFYDIRTSGLSSTAAVNTIPRESNLAHGNAEEMTVGWLSPNDQAAPISLPDEQVSPEEQDRRQRFWRFLLLAALLFFITEGLLSNQAILKPE